MNLEYYHLYVCRHVSSIEIDRMCAVTAPLVEEDIRQRMSRFIADKLGKREDTHHSGYITYTMDVYVIPPDALFKVIRDEAMRLASLVARGGGA